MKDDLQEHDVWSIIKLTVDGVRRERKINHVKRKSYAYKAEVPRAEVVADNSKINISYNLRSVTVNGSNVFRKYNLVIFYTRKI